MMNIPKWPQNAGEEEKFKSFIFFQLDRRLDQEMRLMADEVQRPENTELFIQMVAAGWSPPPAPKRRRGRPVKPAVERQLLPSEAAARLAIVIRQLFKEYWGRQNLKRPSPAQLAAEYMGLRVLAVETRLKRGKVRRPN